MSRSFGTGLEPPSPQGRAGVGYRAKRDPDRLAPRPRPEGSRCAAYPTPNPPLRGGNAAVRVETVV
jgi:hypothetical protein